MTVTVTHRQLQHPDLRQVALDSRFLERLNQSLRAGTCPPDCFGLTAALMLRGRTTVPNKGHADVFVSWLRALCGCHFATLIHVSFSKEPS